MLKEYARAKHHHSSQRIEELEEESNDKKSKTGQQSKKYHYLHESHHCPDQIKEKPDDHKFGKTTMTNDNNRKRNQMQSNTIVS